MGTEKPSVKHSLFEDDESCVKVSKTLVLTHWTKNIALAYHHFHSHANQGLILIESICTGEQHADVSTKLISEPQFT